MDLKHVVDLRGKKANTDVFLEVLRLRHADTLSLLLVNCHDVTVAIFDRWISRPTGVKSPLKWHNQPRQKLKDLRKSKVQTTTTTTLGTRGFFLARGWMLRCRQWPKPETAHEKSLTPRVERLTIWLTILRPTVRAFFTPLSVRAPFYWYLNLHRKGRN